MYENNIYYTDENQKKNKEVKSATGAYSGAEKKSSDSYYQNYDYGTAYGSSYGTSYNSYDNYGKKPEKKKTGLAVKAVTFAICGALFGVFAGAGFYGVNILNQYLENDQDVTIQSGQPESPETEESVTQPITQLSTQVITTDVTEVVEDVMPAMVSIINNYLEKGTFFGQTYTQEAQSSGSGIIIAEDDVELLIATNYHVIADAETLQVTFIDGSTAQAQVKGKDSSMDLAVIAIPLDSLEAETKQAITVAEMGDSEQLKLGEQVIAIGNSLGYGQSVTGGWVSALNREISMEDGSKGTFIQTDAAINGGNSGGALLNMNGQVVGINSSKISGYGVEGMGYAIPISAAEPIISELMTRETREKVEDGNVGYMGVSMSTVTEDVAYMFNAPMGVLVRDVEEGSPAEKAGILGGDILTNFDGEKILEYEDLQKALQYYGPGETADIIVMRQTDGEYQAVELTITLGERPKEK